MTAIEMMKEMQEQLNQMKLAIEDMDADIHEMRTACEDKKDEYAALKSKIDFGMQLAKEFEEEKEQKIQDDSEALSTLYVAHATGGATDGDFKTFCEQTSLDIPDELTASELTATEEGPQEAIAASG